MKINPYGRIPSNPYQKQIKHSAEVQNVQSTKRDKIEISTEALEMQKIDGASAVRKEKVEALKNQINSGNYQVNYEQVAEKFFDFWNKK
jgi:negative regulator of flagellin synthesis FlgM